MAPHFRPMAPQNACHRVLRARRRNPNGEIGTRLRKTDKKATRALVDAHREVDVHMVRTVETLLRENIHGVFSEPDSEKRHKAIARLWAEDGVFIDHNARYEGHSGIALAADGLAKKFPNFVFTERGEIIAIPGAGKLDWGFGSAGAEAVVTGSDVLVIRGDKIGAIYTFLDQPKR